MVMITCLRDNRSAKGSMKAMSSRMSAGSSCKRVMVLGVRGGFWARETGEGCQGELRVWECATVASPIYADWVCGGRVEE